jgi:hypothetical protein
VFVDGVINLAGSPLYPLECKSVGWRLKVWEISNNFLVCKINVFKINAIVVANVAGVQGACE